MVAVSAFVLARDGTRLDFAWKATGGRIRANSSEAQWDFRNELAGVYSSTVTVTSAGEVLGDCSFQVTVTEAERGSPLSGPRDWRSTARAYLAPDMREESGFGLYSYLLFGSPPTTSSRLSDAAVGAVEQPHASSGRSAPL